EVMVALRDIVHHIPALIAMSTVQYLGYKLGYIAEMGRTGRAFAAITYILVPLYLSPPPRKVLLRR
ncbi:12495_t:CDS:2, partial [Acaulospora colombiana]